MHFSLFYSVSFFFLSSLFFSFLVVVHYACDCSCSCTCMWTINCATCSVLASATCKSLQCAANYRHVHVHVQQKVAWCRTEPGGALVHVHVHVFYKNWEPQLPRLQTTLIPVHVHMLKQSPSVHGVLYCWWRWQLRDGYFAIECYTVLTQAVLCTVEVYMHNQS